jgi:hypothetical protein
MAMMNWEKKRIPQEVKKWFLLLMSTLDAQKTGEVVA